MSGPTICCKAAQVGYHAPPTATAPYPYSPDFAVARSRRQGLVRGCAVRRRRFPVGARPTRRLSLQPEATGAGMEETKCLKPLVSGSRIGDRASVQAAT